MTGAELRSYLVEVADLRLSLTGKTTEQDTVRLEAEEERGSIYRDAGDGWVYRDPDLGEAKLVRVCKASGRVRYVVEFWLWDLAKRALRIREGQSLCGISRPARTEAPR
jgi:hypothetical protein